MKFSIRDLLLVTVIVALAVGWWVDSSTRMARMSKENELWKARAESSKDILEYSSGRALEWAETMPSGKPPYPSRQGPLLPVKD